MEWHKPFHLQQTLRSNSIYMEDRFAYPVSITRGSDGEFLVTFPDLPEARTFGWTEREAFEAASDALRVALRGRIRDEEAVPVPSRIEQGAPYVAAPAEVAAKIAVYDAFQRTGMSKAEFAGRLHVHKNEAQRILDPNHRTKLDRLEEAAKVLGGRLQVIFTAA